LFRNFDAFSLVLMQHQRLAKRLVFGLQAENLCAFCIEQSTRDMFLDRAARDKVRIQLDDRGRPKTATAICCLNDTVDVARSDCGKATRKTLVVTNELITKTKNVHQVLHTFARLQWVGKIESGDER
jgi:hypothetical protein